MILDLLTSACLLLGSGLVLTSALAMMRAEDALTRLNVFSPATGLGIPLIVLGGYLHRLSTVGFSLMDAVRFVITVIALLVVSSTASNILARAAYLSGSPVHPSTDPQDLERDTQEPTDA